MAGFCDRYNEASRSIKEVRVFYQLSDCQLLKKDCVTELCVQCCINVPELIAVKLDVIMRVAMSRSWPLSHIWIESWQHIDRVVFFSHRSGNRDSPSESFHRRFLPNSYSQFTFVRDLIKHCKPITYTVEKRC